MGGWSISLLEMPPDILIPSVAKGTGEDCLCLCSEALEGQGRGVLKGCSWGCGISSIFQLEGPLFIS